METLKHECGVALIRLKKPISFFEKKYGTSRYALNKLYLLMQKQHNRGQEGAGAACVSLEAEPGQEFIFRERKEGKNAIPELFEEIGKSIAQTPTDENEPFIGECYMGHLRYSTTGRAGITYVHPHLRRNNYRQNTLALCGNFNLTNVDEIFQHLKSQGQHPRRTSDTTILLEQLGSCLDTYNDSVEDILKNSMPLWDGGFVICGIVGDGRTFAARDPWGIRSAFFYEDDEIIVIASERPAIQTVMNVKSGDIKELQPGEALIIDSQANISLSQIVKPTNVKQCSFERIYFSRGNDADIYRERKALGRGVVPAILKTVDNDLANSVFSFIPNTAEVAFWGMNEYLKEYLDQEKYQKIVAAGASITDDTLKEIISQRVRIEKVAIKDIKLRTFISESGKRDELSSHVYDITYDSIVPHRDNLIVIDDSIVRGTTLKQSIITILSRLDPKKLVIVSSAPQIRYPDFYGIDMADISQLIAFKAMIELVSKKRLTEVYKKCLAQVDAPKGEMKNYVCELYAPFSDEQISAEIARIVTPDTVKCDVDIIFQTRETLREVCSGHKGDWYFTGEYPTDGGLRMLNASFIEFYQRTHPEL
ncbi:MAG: amidophosphoribosyltransferase [Rikenellaceae bacterium]